MRFLPEEHAAITAILERNGVRPNAVLFVKRRGRLHVEVPGRSGAFAFFRQKRTKLDELGNWQEHTEYYIGMEKKEPCDWLRMIAAFEEWLQAR